ncbi:MAG: hypothetical protein AB1486_10320 [Planctomycetota bacterium]
MSTSTGSRERLWLACTCLLLASTRAAWAAPFQEPSPSAPQEPSQAQESSHPLDVIRGLDMSDPDAINKKLEEVGAQLAGIRPDDPQREARQRALELQQSVLKWQLLLLEGREKKLLEQRMAAHNPESLRKELEAFEKRLKEIDPQRETASLGQIEKLADLDAAVKTQYEEPRQKAETQVQQTTDELNKFLSDLAAFPQLEEASQKSLDESRRRLDELRTQFRQGESLAPEEFDLLSLRATVREQEQYYYTRRLERLREYRTLTEKYLEILKLRLEVDTKQLEVRRRLADAAQAVLKQRLDEEQKRTQEELAAKQREVELAREEHEKLYRQAEVVVLEVDRDAKASLALLNEVTQQQNSRQQELNDAKNSLDRYTNLYLYRDAPNAPPLPPAEVVTAMIRELERETRRTVYRARVRALEDERRAARRELGKVMDRLGSLDQQHATWTADAERAFSGYLEKRRATELPGKTWETEKSRWQSLGNRLEALLQQRRDYLQQTLDRLTQSLTTVQEIDRFRRDLRLLLYRQNLFVRSPTLISLDAIGDALNDVPRLPGYLIRTARQVATYVVEERHARRLAFFGVSLVPVAVALLALRRAVRGRVLRLLALDLTKQSVRTAITVACLLQALCIALFFVAIAQLAVLMLPDLPENISDLVAALGWMLAALWSGRRLGQELFRPDPPQRAVIPIDPVTSRRTWVGLNLLILATLVLLPAYHALGYLGYANEGAIAIIYLLYKALVGILVLTVLLRRSFLLNLLPSAKKPLGRLLRLLVSALHPLLLLAVPTLIVLEALQYNYLASVVVGFSGTFLAVTLAGYILFHSLCFLL